eukprot:3140373-Pleurochrysis_carterae.AAC.1
MRSVARNRASSYLPSARLLTKLQSRMLTSSMCVHSNTGEIKHSWICCNLKPARQKGCARATFTNIVNISSCRYRSLRTKLQLTAP